MSRLPFRREHTGSAAMDRVQRSSQEARSRVGLIEDDLLADLPRAIVLKDTFTTTRITRATTKLTFPVRAGEMWAFLFLGWAGSSTVNGMMYAIKGPAGSRLQALLNSSTVNAVTDARQQYTAVNTLGTAIHTVAGGTRDDSINGRIWISETAPEGSEVAIQIASAVAGDTSTLLRGAMLRYHRFTEV